MGDGGEKEGRREREVELESFSTSPSSPFFSLSIILSFGYLSQAFHPCFA